jgi:poly-gamma-glutamate capsule biosynthesis protein CapA/YwtB (metallophosphatase superfamily)
MICITAALLILSIPGGAVSNELPQGTITISAVGDIMMGSTYPDVKLPPQDGAGMFDGVKPFLANSDVVFGNLEGPLFDGEATPKCQNPSKTCYAFKTPTRYVRHLKDAGFNVLGIANNHANDFGPAGLSSTLSTLEQAGIQATGGSAVAVFTVNEKRVALAGFSYSMSSCSHSILNVEEAKRIVRELKQTHDLVIVSFHGGAEGKGALRIPGGNEVFLGEDRGDVKAFARAVIDAGAAMVIGHGPHVVRALEVYKGKLIAYSLGNFLAYERFNLEGASGRSFVLRVRLDADTGDFVEGKVVSVRLVNEGIPEPDPEHRAVDLARRLTRQDILNAGITIGGDGILALRQLPRAKKDQGLDRDAPMPGSQARPR